MSRQFSKPSPRFTIHRHHRNQSRRECQRKLLFFCKKILCVKVFKKQIFSSKEAPPRDSRTGWFPRNFWPPKCQLRSWNTQFTLTLNHVVIVFKTKKTPTAAVPPSICVGTLCVATRFALIRSRGTLRCQDSFPNQAPVSRFTDIMATNHVGNVNENN